MTGWRHLATIAVVAVALGACSFDGLAFVEDRRLRFTSPGDRELVQLPVTVDWELEGGDLPRAETDDGTPIGAFGVFVDARPQPPGEPLSWHARDDETCERDPDCPDDEWYRVRGIHTTTRSEFTLERLAPPADPDRREIHTITVVLLGTDGVRLGESAWQLEIEVDRDRS